MLGLLGPTGYGQSATVPLPGIAPSGLVAFASDVLDHLPYCATCEALGEAMCSHFS